VAVVTAQQPTIIATSIGFQRDSGGLGDCEAGPAYRYAARLARAGASPRVCVLATATGDDPASLVTYYSGLGRAGMVVTHLSLFSMPNIENMREHLLRQDIIWVGGGSTANLLALWRVHGLDTILAECWAAGVVLMGVSAGSICWHSGGTTDSFRLPLQPITDGLGLLPYSNSPHYDAEPGRRPLTQQLIADGVLPDGYATDNGTGLVFFGTELHEAITEVAGASAYSISRAADGRAVEQALPTRLLS
jgi:Peptidase family S51